MPEPQKHILLVDDDKEILNLLSKLLEQSAYKVTTASSVEDFSEKLGDGDTCSFDMLLLDVMLPDGDGISLCQKVRQTHNVPIILITANDSQPDRVLGLEFGADDYIQKPFHPRELLARVKAVFRRSEPCEHVTHTQKEPNGPPVYHFNNWQLNTGTHELLSPEGAMVPITSGVYDILLVFMENPQRVLSRDFLLDVTRNREAGPFDRTIDVQISRLRQKIEEDPKSPRVIKTIHGGGYMFTEKIECV